LNCSELNIQNYKDLLERVGQLVEEQSRRVQHRCVFSMCQLQTRCEISRVPRKQINIVLYSCLLLKWDRCCWPRLSTDFRGITKTREINSAGGSWRKRKEIRSIRSSFWCG